jgi:hypothetical protein
MVLYHIYSYGAPREIQEGKLSCEIWLKSGNKCMLNFRRVNLKESGNMENEERGESSESVLWCWGWIQLANYFAQHRPLYHPTYPPSYATRELVSDFRHIFITPHRPPPSRPLLQLMSLFTGLEPRWEVIIRTHQDRARGPLVFLYDGETVVYRGKSGQDVALTIHPF